ncbi:hypothetical protein ACFQBQ_05000 [Granulicella cerasi]|uniref:Uncharacterized protein n=1 Tax=Granulicella cerasi TaxID=741063 RepID=A0ABW1Z796_9BACT|nr:hypothetical protein [Granulicella cerasi]
MRKLSEARRRLVVMCSVMASMSGVGPVLMRGHSRALWVWTAVVVAMAIRIMVMAVRVKRTEGCAL